MSEQSPERRRLHLKEVTSEPPSTETLGGLLRATRMKLGEDLKSASRVTKIRADFLEALEDGKLDALPGRTYAIGFVRTYAEFLGLDPAECANRLKAEHPVAEKPPEAQPVGLADIQPEMRIGQSTMIILGILALLMIYGGFYLFRSANQVMDQRATTPTEEASASETATPAPQAAAPASTGGVPSAAATTTQSSVGPAEAAPATGSAPGTFEVVAPAGEPATAPATAATASQTPAEPPPVTATPPTGPQPAPQMTITPPAVGPAVAEAALPAPAEEPDTVPPEPEPAAGAEPDTTTLAEPPQASPSIAPPEESGFEMALARAPRIYGATNKNNRIVLRAKDQVFVRIETAGPRTKVLFEGMLEPDQLYFVPAGQETVLVTRNGGALDVFVDGDPSGTAGPDGVALKGLPLDPGALKRQ